MKDQLDLNLNYQYTSSNKLYGVDPFIPKLLFYGIIKALTLSVESGYYLDKTQYGADFIDTITTECMGDLITFPRCDVWSKTTEKSVWEGTVGLGLKIPVGKCIDSLRSFYNAITGVTKYQKKPPNPVLSYSRRLCG